MRPATRAAPQCMAATAARSQLTKIILQKGARYSRCEPQAKTAEPRKGGDQVGADSPRLHRRFLKLENGRIPPCQPSDKDMVLASAR